MKDHEQRLRMGSAKLRDVLDASLAGGLEPVWLIDPTRYPTVADCANALGMTVGHFDGLTNLYSHYTPTLREWGPRLLPANDAPIELVMMQAAEALAASLLVAPHARDVVAAHLAGLAKLPQSDGSRLLFRFQDPLVMANLMPLLTEAQQSALLGPIQSWWAFDECSGLVSIRRTAQARATQLLSISQRQMEALDARLLPATVITQVNEVDTTLLAGMDRCGQWCDVRERLRQARSHGLAVTQDLSLFVILSLQLPSDFDRVGPVARALDRAKETGVGFSSAVAQVPVEEWREWDEVLDER